MAYHIRNVDTCCLALLLSFVLSLMHLFLALFQEKAGRVMKVSPSARNVVLYATWACLYVALEIDNEVTKEGQS